MITVDGITIPKVISIECSHDTGFMIFIEFYHDSRLDGCIDLDKLKEYEPIRICEESNKDVGICKIILNKDADIKVLT